MQSPRDGPGAIEVRENSRKSPSLRRNCARRYWTMDPDTVLVTYLELRQHPTALRECSGAEPVALESLSVDDYLGLYRRVGGPVRWDQRLRLPTTELHALLHSERLRI